MLLVRPVPSEAVLDPTGCRLRAVLGPLSPVMSGLGTFSGRLEDVWGHLGSVLGPSSAVLVRVKTVLEASEQCQGILGRLQTLSGRSCTEEGGRQKTVIFHRQVLNEFGLLEDCLRVAFDRLGAMLGHPGASFDRLDTILGRLGPS